MGNAMIEDGVLAAVPIVLEPGRYTLLVGTEGNIRRLEWSKTEQPYYKWVKRGIGGSFEYLGIQGRSDAYCYGHDEARILRMPVNVRASRLIGCEVYGPIIVVVGIGPDEETLETEPEGFGVEI